MRFFPPRGDRQRAGLAIVTGRAPGDTLPSVGSRGVRILAFSDLHRDERVARSLVERSAQVDVVAGVGDFASVHRGLERMIDVLGAIDRPALLVPGNNETDAALRAACS